MKTSLDCMACFVRQSLEAARLASNDPEDHERVMRDVLGWSAEMDLNLPPPVVAQQIHRRLRQLTGIKDLYRRPKDYFNLMALEMLPTLRTQVDTAADPLIMAMRLALAGNIIDMGVNSSINESQVREAITQAASQPIIGNQNDFKHQVKNAGNILYLADNAGEIVFDRLLVEQLNPERVILAVRGGPILNDATIHDAEAAGLHEIVTIIDNGSDAPGTILSDCHENFRTIFDASDLIIAKGQGNFETLSLEPGNIFFLFKVKCPVVATHTGQNVGAHMLARPVIPHDQQ